MYSHEEDIDSAIDVFKQAIEHYQSEQVCVSQMVVRVVQVWTTVLHFNFCCV